MQKYSISCIGNPSKKPWLLNTKEREKILNVKYVLSLAVVNKKFYLTQTFFGNFFLPFYMKFIAFVLRLPAFGFEYLYLFCVDVVISCYLTRYPNILKETGINHIIYQVKQVYHLKWFLTIEINKQLRSLQSFL